MLIALLVAVSSTLISARPASALGTLGNLSWSPSSTVAGASSSYTFTLTATDTGANGKLSSVTMSVPTGTGGTPTVGTVSAFQGGGFAPFTLAGMSASLAGTTLTFSFTSMSILAGSVLSIQINGLTNTSTTGSYTSTLTSFNGATAVDTGTTQALAVTPGALTRPYWYASSTTIGQTGSAYSYAFTTATASSLSSVTMTVPPGTGGTPAVGTVTGVPTGGTVALSGQILTYSFTSTSVPASTAVTVQVTGLTNTNGGLSFSYGGEMATKNASAFVDGGGLEALTFTTGALSALSWSSSSNTVGATGSAYTFGFTAGTNISLSSFTMSVPVGTGGTPAVGAVSATDSGGHPITMGSPSVGLSGSTLTFSFSGNTNFPSGTVVSIEITGMTNTSVAGSYPSSIVTYTSQTFLPPQIDSGLAPAVNFTATTLNGLSWAVSATATGATGVTYTYSFALSASATLSSITMSAPPGTAGTPTVGSVSPPGIAGGSVSLSGGVITYTFPAAAVSSSSTITLVLNGITNTSTPSVYAASVIANNGGSVVASGTTPAVSFTSGVLSALSWSASTTSTGATGVSYTYGFTTGTGFTPTSITMTVPAGTTGTPALGTVSIYEQSNGFQTPTGQSIVLSGTTLTYSFSVGGFLN
ncbi:MAG TPA: hypothetical protein VNV87_19585, partial [Acidimicrobiales bacterium]|nr:hypothetical protein [Acidimicrobiales bacterium]